MPAPQPALALTATGHSEQKSWKRNQDLVDALPYVDGLTAQEKQAVDALVMEEASRTGVCPLFLAENAALRCLNEFAPLLQMRRSPKQPADYLGELPPAPSFNAEVRRVSLFMLPCTTYHWMCSGDSPVRWVCWCRINQCWLPSSCGWRAGKAWPP